MENDAHQRHVAIVERCTLTEAGLCHLFHQSSDGRYVIHLFRHVQALNAAMARQPFWAVIYSLSGGRELRQESLLCLNAVSQSHPETKRIVLTNNADEALLIRNLSPSGLHGILSKSESVAWLSERLLALLNGTRQESDDDLNQWVMSHNGCLSPTELAILRYMTYGYSMPEIATQLARNIKTIRAHKFNAMSKLGVNSDMGLLSAADIIMHLPASNVKGQPALAAKL